MCLATAGCLLVLVRIGAMHRLVAGFAAVGVAFCGALLAYYDAGILSLGSVLAIFGIIAYLVLVEGWSG